MILHFLENYIILWYEV